MNNNFEIEFGGEPYLNPMSQPHSPPVSDSPPKISEGWALNLAERLEHSLFSGVCDGGRVIQFSVVERSLTGAGHWKFSF